MGSTTMLNLRNHWQKCDRKSVETGAELADLKMQRTGTRLNYAYLCQKNKQSKKANYY